MTDQATQEGCEQMGMPVKAHEKLAAFAGTFTAEIKIWMGPGDPHESTGTMTNTMELDGRFLSQVFAGDATAGPFPDLQGRGFWGYNTVLETYEGFWIDTASTVMQNQSGDIDAAGSTWTMVGTVPNPQGGGNMTKRSVIKLEDNDHHSMEMFFDTPDGEVKAMEIKYTRKS